MHVEDLRGDNLSLKRAVLAAALRWEWLHIINIPCKKEKKKGLVICLPAGQIMQ